MQIGLHVMSFSWPGGPERIGPTFAEIARNAEQAGVASLSVMDHFFQIGAVGPPEEPMLEAYTALGFAAGRTERITLGALATSVVYRHPGILIKQVTTLDVLSGGRAQLCIGAAWNDEEARGLGVPFPPLAERFERLEETLQIAHQMFRGDDSPYQGRHYQLERPLSSPLPLSLPRPQILIGGGGEKKTLRLVAKYGDACNLFDSPELPHKLDVLREHCAREGRPYEEIEKTVLSMLPGDDSAVTQGVETCHRLAELGVDHLMTMLPNAHEPAAIDRLGEIAAQAAKIVPAGR